MKGRAGFTVVELVIGVVIVVLIMTNLSMVMRTSSDVSEASLIMSQLEQQASQTMDRITMSLMAASSEDLNPTAENPNSLSMLDYEVGLGSVGNTVIWGDPERIELRQETGEIVWTENPGDPGERSVVWSRGIPDLLEAELANGIDDNANQLDDETGLSFSMDREKVTVHLTVMRQDDAGEPYYETLEAHVTCRN